MNQDVNIHIHGGTPVINVVGGRATEVEDVVPQDFIAEYEPEVVLAKPDLYGEIVTATGKLVAPYKLSMLDVDIRDIARALSNMPRYGGHLPHGVHYSVAQHSVLVSLLVQEKCKEKGIDKDTTLYLARLALLHDAAEAYRPDIPSPIKTKDDEYYESLILDGISAKYNVSLDHLDEMVKWADEVIFYTECRDIMRGAVLKMMIDRGVYAPWNRVIVPMSATAAEVYFLNEWFKITGDDVRINDAGSYKLTPSIQDDKAGYPPLVAEGVPPRVALAKDDPTAVEPSGEHGGE